MELGKLVRAIRYCSPLIRLSFDMTGGIFDESVSTAFDIAQDNASIKAFAK